MSKNYLCLVMLFFTALMPVMAEEVQLVDMSSETSRPKWEEFCESGYENANKTDRQDIFDVFSFVKAERAKKNYWASRRVSFQKYLNYCENISDDNDRGACYSELRKIETDKNNDYSRQRKQLLYQHNIIIDKPNY